MTGRPGRVWLNDRMTTIRPVRKRHWLRNTLIVLGVLVLIIAGIAGGYALTLSRSFDEGTEKIEQAFPEETNRPAVPEGPASAAQNILLLGSDTRGELSRDLDSVR